MGLEIWQSKAAMTRFAVLAVTVLAVYMGYVSDTWLIYAAGFVGAYALFSM